MKKKAVILALPFFLAALIYNVPEVISMFRNESRLADYIIAVLLNTATRAIPGVAAMLAVNRMLLRPAEPKTIHKFVIFSAAMISLCFFMFKADAFLRTILTHPELHFTYIGGRIFWNASRIISYFPAGRLFTSFLSIKNAFASISSAEGFRGMLLVGGIVDFLDGVIFIFGAVRILLFFSNATRGEDDFVRYGFAPAVKEGFSNFFTFYGTSSRSEFWWFMLLNAIVYVPLGFLAAKIFESLDSILSHGFPALIFFLAVAMGVLSLPTCAVRVRRAHDAGFMGFVAWIPIFGTIVMLLPSNKESIYRTDREKNAGLSLLVKIIFVIALGFVEFNLFKILFFFIYVFYFG